VFWREFFPRFDSEIPPQIHALLCKLAADRFGPEFDSTAGVVRFNCPQRLRAGLDEVSAGRLTDPHIAFFLSANLGWAKGDELVCLTELTPQNLTPAGRRMMAPQICASHSPRC
jgi:hypothetical protein